MAADIAAALEDYRTAWRGAEHAGDGDVILRLPVYVAPTMAQAQAAPEDSTMHHYRRLQQTLLRSTGTADGDARATRAAKLATLTYEDVLQERVVFGTPGHVAERLQHLHKRLRLSGFIMESNVGGRIQRKHVVQSIRLFGREVAPMLRATAA